MIRGPSFSLVVLLPATCPFTLCFKISIPFPVLAITSEFYPAGKRSGEQQVPSLRTFHGVTNQLKAATGCWIFSVCSSTTSTLHPFLPFSALRGLPGGMTSKSYLALWPLLNAADGDTLRKLEGGREWGWGISPQLAPFQVAGDWLYLSWPMSSVDDLKNNKWKINFHTFVNNHFIKFWSIIQFKSVTYFLLTPWLDPSNSKGIFILNWSWAKIKLRGSSRH